jgi:hypothetical protein
VTRNWRILARNRIYPDIMFAAVMTEVATLIAKVFLQLTALHL